MKVKDDLIMFKSDPEMFEKEKDGRKPNTIRWSYDADEIAQMTIFARDFKKDCQKYIQIENSVTGETFVRRLSDISFYGGVYVFSWLVTNGQGVMNSEIASSSLMTESLHLLTRSISSNCILARQARLDHDSTRELQTLLWASRDIHRLLSLWNAGEVADGLAKSCIESACHIAERIRELVTAGRGRKRNQLVDALRRGPCTRKELPYPYQGVMNLASPEAIMKIKPAGTRTNARINRYGRFETVYYLQGDEDRAVAKFIQVNAEPLGKVDFGRGNALQSGLPEDIYQKIKEQMEAR